MTIFRKNKLKQNISQDNIAVRWSMKWKLMAIMTVLMTGLVAVLTYTQITSQKDMLKNELDKRIALMKENLVERGKSFTANLVTEAENDIASFNFSGAMERIRTRVENNPEIKYAVFLNPDGEIALSLKAEAARFSRVEKEEKPDRKNYQTSNYDRMTIKEYSEQDGDIIEIINPIQIGTKVSGTLKLVFTLKLMDREIEKTGKQIGEDMNKVVVKSTLTSLGFILICFVIMFIMAAKASKPLILLTDSARKLSKGDFTASSDIRIRSTDEVGVLALTFIKMSRKLEESYRKLEEYNRTLEQKVAERTEEIAQKNIRLNEAIRDIEAARREAETANRAKGDFLANMSHEIRTPMNAIIGMTGLALNKEMSPTVRNYLNTVRTSAHSLLGLINDILDFSKIEAGKLELESVEFRLYDLMDNLCDMFAGKVSAKEVELIVSVDTDVSDTLIGDPLRLGQILINLVNNAFKFTDQGEIAVRTERLADQDAEDTETVMLGFSVRDTGIGISADKLSRLFTPFTQVNGSFSRKFGGTGLGLSISRLLAEMMGGEIRVNSEPDKGSTFYFTARLGLKSESMKMTLPGDLRGMNVLISDDNETSRKALEERLKFLGFNVTSADSGKKALEKLADTARYDLLMIDRKMPETDGIEVVKKIRNDERFAGIPIILMAEIGNEEVLRFVETGFVNTVAVKPLKQSLLPDIIMGLFGYEADRVSECKPMPDREADAIKKIRGARVLLAEDNFINQQVAVEILQSIGIIADIAENGREAVQALTGPEAQSYDAVLMDIQMPEMDGFEATRIIRSGVRGPGSGEYPSPRTPHLVPIIAMTAHAMKGDKEKCLEAGMDDYVSKPIDTSELFSVLSRWIKPSENRIQNPEAPDNPDASVSGFPESLPGIHIESALDRLRGSKKVFIKILNDFSENYADVATDIRESLEKGDIAAARRINHTLKGVAGNFSATFLYKAAMELEAAIKEKRSGDFDALLKILEEALSVVLISANSLKEKDISADDSPEAEYAGGGRELRDIIAELSEMLSRNNPKASACLDVLKAHPDAAGIQKELAFLKKQIGQFDFKGAGKTLDQIAESMKTEIR